MLALLNELCFLLRMGHFLLTLGMRVLMNRSEMFLEAVTKLSLTRWLCSVHTRVACNIPFFL